MTALPRLAAPARRALAAAGITTLEDCVREGRATIARLPGLGTDAMAALDEAVARAGFADAEELLAS